MRENTPLLPGLSPVSGKCVEACFDGGSLSSDAGVLALREIDIRLNMAARLAACIADTRQPEPQSGRHHPFPPADDRLRL